MLPQTPKGAWGRFFKKSQYVEPIPLIKRGDTEKPNE